MKRRRFLELSATTALGAGLMPFPVATSLAQESAFSDYKCLVSIFLLGGNDSFNLVVPRSNAEYNVYATSRQNLALAQEDLLAIAPDNPDGADYGLHPTAGGLRELFDQGDLAIIGNVGPLVEPVSLDSYLNGSVSLPPQLFSHNDQQDQWHTLKGKAQMATGWGGRISDLLASASGEQRLAMNISAAGTTLFQAGEHTIPYTVGTDGANTYGALEADAAYGVERRASFEEYLGGGFANIHTRALAAVHQRSLASADLVNAALEGGPSMATAFPTSSLGRQLEIVARLIAVKDEFDMTRQIFFVASGGFDTHDEQNERQPGLIENLDQSISAFNSAMIEFGMADQVVAFTQSDFGRTLTSNGDGTDHGWGGHQLVTGAPVQGRQIYGVMPRLEIGGPDDVRGGRIIPTLSVDQYAATLARWFGVDESGLGVIAPNLQNFGSADLGFL